MRLTSIRRRFCKKFETLSKSHRRLQAIVLARVMTTTNTTTQIVDIKMDHTHNDMEHVVEHALHGLASLKDQKEFNQEKVVEQIVHHAQGNFLWAILTAALLKKEQTCAAFMKAISCTTAFLALTETITFTARTEILTQKEEILKYIIVASKHQHGKTSEIVVRYNRLLAELYIDIKEELHAEEVWKELREIIVLRHGKGSEDEKKISKNLKIVLKKGQKKEDLVEYESSILEKITAMEVWDIRRIKMTFELAISCEGSWRTLPC
jgi:hypothetical protein